MYPYRVSADEEELSARVGQRGQHLDEVLVQLRILS
jgi:hypothetical protein